MTTQAQTTEQESNAFNQAKAQANSIVAMVAALSCDYDRLEELKDELAELREEFDSLPENVGVDFAWWARNHPNFSSEQYDELKELEEAADDCASEDDARERIEQDPLDVQVRSDWYTPGDRDNKPSEFQILLCTGGPAVRIVGELDEHLQPCRAWIEYQDWFTPWSEAVGIIEQSTLLEYCRQFYFGE